MSEVTKLAEAEAARAESEPDENEQAEDEEVEGAEGAPEPQPEPAPSSEPTDEERKAWDAEHKRHANALAKVMGADFDLLVPCDECGAVGYRPPDQLRTNQRYIGCETCNAFGVVLTGSKAQGNETQNCPVCLGRGFLEEMPAAPAGQPAANGVTEPQPQYGTPQWMGDPQVGAQPGYAAPPA
jgi:DnaJ-class molecular chaperone